MTPPERVLVVDDDAEIRTLFRSILDRAGYATSEAHDPASALAALAVGDFSVALCDVRLHGDDGLDLARRILQGDGPAVVMVTGVDDRALAQTALEVGAYGYLVKPVRPTELLLNVANALRRRLLERDHRRLVAELEQRVWERTTELRTALAEVEAADVVRREFVQNVSHEFRTPLTAILAGAGLIERTVEREQLTRIAGTIDAQGRRLLLLVEQLLQIANLDHALELEDIDLAHLRSLLALATEPARAAGRGIAVSVAGDEPLRASPGRLRQAITHLVENAVKFTPPEARVEVRAEEMAGDWSICVADDGPGLRPEDRTRVWNAFVQVDGSETRRHGGLGVGLYLARRLVEAQGGTVATEETPGGGATFILRFPGRPR